MNIYAQELLNICGQKFLDKVLKEFPGGTFYIVGSDPDRYVVGDSSQNVSFRRPCGKILERSRFPELTSKVSRKGPGG